MLSKKMSLCYKAAGPSHSLQLVFSLNYFQHSDYIKGQFKTYNSPQTTCETVIAVVTIRMASNCKWKEKVTVNGRKVVLQMIMR